MAWNGRGGVRAEVLATLVVAGCSAPNGVGVTEEEISDGSGGSTVAVGSGGTGTGGESVEVSSGGQMMGATGGQPLATGGTVATGGTPMPSGGTLSSGGTGGGSGGASTGGLTATGGEPSTGGVSGGSGGSVGTGGQVVDCGTPCDATELVWDGENVVPQPICGPVEDDCEQEVYCGQCPAPDCSQDPDPFYPAYWGNHSCDDPDFPHKWHCDDTRRAKLTPYCTAVYEVINPILNPGSPYTVFEGIMCCE